MSKLSKHDAKKHMQAVDLLKKEKLSTEERLFVLENWREDAQHINSIAGAFFTPIGLANDFSINVSGRRVLDLCAGIGRLSYAVKAKNAHANEIEEIVCVEINPDYVEVGRKILPDAIWICADVFNIKENIGRFDCVISNPPFGVVKRNGKSKRYSGREFEFHVMDLASEYANYGVFIVPQESAPFKYSGQRGFSENGCLKFTEFSKKTGIIGGPGCGVDTSFYSDDWHGVSVSTEVVLLTFPNRDVGKQASLMDVFTGQQK